MAPAKFIFGGNLVHSTPHPEIFLAPFCSICGVFITIKTVDLVSYQSHLSTTMDCPTSSNTQLQGSIPIRAFFCFNIFFAVLQLHFEEVQDFFLDFFCLFIN
jgi:hypothetical protein